MAGISKRTSNSDSKPVEPGSIQRENGFDRFGLAGDLKLLIDSTPALIDTGLPNGDLDFFNSQWLEYVGLPLRALTGWKWIGCIHPDDADGIVDRWRASLTDGHPFVHEARVRRADGQYRWMAHHKVAVRDEAGSIVKWHGSSVDIEDGKRAEEKAKRDELELREIIDFLPHHIMVFDANGCLLQANRLVLDYTGRTLEEMQALETTERIRIDIHPDDVERGKGERKRNMLSGQPFEFERRARRKDGIYRWFLFRYKPLLDEAGQVSRWFCTTTDIQEIKNSEEELRIAVNTMSAFLHTARPDGLVDFLNRSWLEYLGLPLEAALARCDVLDIRDPTELDLILWDFGSVIHPEDLEEITAVWSRIVKTKVVEDAYARIRRYDGAYRWFLFRTCPRFDQTGKLVKWYGAAIDIEDQKRAEERLRQKEIEVANQLRLAINTTPGLAWTAGPDGSADFLNQQWLEYAGLSIEEAIGWGFLSAIHPDDMPGMMEDWKRALRTGDMFETEGRVRRHDGEYRRFLFRGSPLRDSDGNIVKWVGIDTDVEDRRQAEDALRESERNLRLTLDRLTRSEAYLIEAQRLSRTGSFGCKVSTGEMIWSDETFRIFEYDRDTTPNLENFRQRVHPDDVALVQGYLDRAMRGSRSCDFEFRLLMPDDSVKHLRLVAHAVEGEKGPREFLGAVTDITERKQAHEALRRSESYLREGQRLSNTGSFGWLVASRAPTHLSEEAYRIFGFDPANGLPTWEDRLRLVHPDDQARWQAQVNRAIADKSGYEVEYRVLLPGGIVRHLYLVAHPMSNDFGELVEFVGTVMDITERWKAQEAIRESEHHLRLLIEAIPALVWCATPDYGKVVYANQRFCHYAGRTLEEMLDCKWITLIHPDDRETTRASWLDALKRGESHEITHRIRHSDGAYRWFQTLAEPLRDRDNRIAQWYGLNIDIDDSRKMADTLRRTKESLSRAMQMATIAELSASIAHEINQPLGAVVSNGDACEMWLSIDPPNIERARGSVQRIIRDGTAAAEVIQRIRALFKQAVPNKLLLEINGVIAEVLRLVTSDVERKKVRIETELSSDLPRTAADRIQMQQLLINLVNNGIESMDNAFDYPKTLTLRSRPGQNSTILIEVCDQGVGVEDAERIFEPFFTTKDKGMGIGLSICRSIVDAHGGSLWATRNREHGTTFSFTIPVLTETS